MDGGESDARTKGYQKRADQSGTLELAYSKLGLRRLESFVKVKSLIDQLVEGSDEESKIRIPPPIAQRLLGHYIHELVNIVNLSFSEISDRATRRSNRWELIGRKWPWSFMHPFWPVW